MSSVIFFSFIIIGLLVHSVQSSDCEQDGAIILEPYRPSVIESPGLENGSYPSNVSCSWTIENSANASQDMKTYLQIDVYRLGCPSDYLRIYTGRSINGASLFDDFECNSDSNTTKPVLITGPIFVVFKSGDNVLDSSIGFRLTFLLANDTSKQGCREQGVITADETEHYISSPDFPDFIPANNNCSWSISTNSSDSVEVSVYFLDVDYDANCTNARLEITVDGLTTTLCDSGSWESRKFEGNEITVSFQTDNSNLRRGFLIGYQVIPIATTTETSTSSPTSTPYYWDQTLMDYNVYPDYNYYWWNDPIVTTYSPLGPISTFSPMEPTTTVSPLEPSTTQEPVTTQPPVTQPSHSWSSWWDPFLYFWMF